MFRCARFYFLFLKFVFLSFIDFVLLKYSLSSQVSGFCFQVPRVWHQRTAPFKRDNLLSSVIKTLFGLWINCPKIDSYRQINLSSQCWKGHLGTCIIREKKPSLVYVTAGYHPSYLSTIISSNCISLCNNWLDETLSPNYCPLLPGDLLQIYGLSCCSGINISILSLK